MIACQHKAFDVEQESPQDAPTDMVSRTASESFFVDSPCILPETDDLKKLKEIASRLDSLKEFAVSETDQFFYDNMLAIEGMPVQIKVRSIASGSTSGYNFLFVQEKGKEVTLSDGKSVGNDFYLKIPPGVSGVPYMIFSDVTKTPLAVGQYKENPDNKILMCATSTPSSMFGCEWDLIPSAYKGYFVIESGSYLGQSMPDNMWSVFNYVLEAKTKDKLGYAQRVSNKPQQEFLISPKKSFILESVEFDLEKATVNRSADYSKTTSIINSNPFPQKQEISVSFMADETSVFNEITGQLKIPIANTNKLKFKRPMPLPGMAILLENTYEDALYSTTLQKIAKPVGYSTTIEMKPSTVLKLTSKFKTYNLSVPFVATAHLTLKRGDVRKVKVAGIWRGYTFADPAIDRPTEEARFYDLETGSQVNYVLEYDQNNEIYIVK